MKNMIVRAMELAYQAHDGQYRRGTGEPYINHPKRVVALLGENLDHVTEEMYATAWLHDVLEDTEVTEDQILELTNETVLRYVKLLTCKKKPAYYTEYLETLSAAPVEVQNIKLCDMLDNMTDLTEADDDTWAKKCIIKRANSMPYLTKADSTLYLIVATRIAILKEVFNLK